MNDYGVIIPVYRHLEPLKRVLAALENCGLPCFLIDDANEVPLKEALRAELGQRQDVQVFRMDVNSGKGASCIEGAREAYRQGVRYAIFIDADDQHNVQDIPRVLALSRAHPEAMILGAPVFDPSAPWSRRFGRIVSNAWVWIETLSLDIRDSLCGFRCLPLEPFLKVAGGVRLGRKMDFDPDIAVRLYWLGIPAINFDTRIRYPASGVSNFHLWRDNAALFQLHTRLFFGMIRRSPHLLSRRWAHT